MPSGLSKNASEDEDSLTQSETEESEGREEAEESSIENVGDGQVSLRGAEVTIWHAEKAEKDDIEQNHNAMEITFATRETTRKKSFCMIL